ncbi:hypothetical protein TWF481_004478 [Arthrobotrys musiformis]|uniref:Cupin type-2 domain-containing protein n=1 Tax=Arthrobotrys musiformis TaxID=47236 RepID=A0AAV9WJP2_9PEZI
MEARPPNKTQISSPLPGLTHHITTNDPNAVSVIYSSTPATWTPILDNKMAFNVVYTNRVPIDLCTTEDVENYNKLMEKGGPGLTLTDSTVCRIVDFGPGVEPVMHRTQSLDFGVVLEGEIELLLDGGDKETRLLKRGDVAVQRGTNHAWRNVTPDNGWARMLFVLQSCADIRIRGVLLEEDVKAAGEHAEQFKERSENNIIHGLPDKPKRSSSPGHEYLI